MNKVSEFMMIVTLRGKEDRYLVPYIIYASFVKTDTFALAHIILSDKQDAARWKRQMLYDVL